jgi:hypothetical protein
LLRFIFVAFPSAADLLSNFNFWTGQESRVRSAGLDPGASAEEFDDRQQDDGTQ